MKRTSFLLMILVTVPLFAQTQLIAEKESFATIKLGEAKDQLSYSSSEEGLKSPGSPFIDSTGHIIIFTTLNGKYFLKIQNTTVSITPYMGNLDEFRISGSRQIHSQQGVLLDGQVQLIIRNDNIVEYRYDWKNIELNGGGYLNYPMPWGAILFSEKQKEGIAIVFDIKNPSEEFSVISQSELKSWLPTQPGGFSIGDDGLLYRNGMLWSAQIPKGGSYAYEYIGRLMSGHQVWVGGGVGSYIRYVTISNSARQIELILDIPWAPDPADDSRGFNPYNYGLGPWGELYCLIPPPPVDVTTYYTPQPGLPAELVVVRNHLKYFGRLNDGGVRLRKEPNTTSDIVGTYQNKTGFRIIEKGTKEETIGGQKNVWYKVRLLDGTEGWFFGSFVHNLYDGPNGNPPPWPNVPDW